MVNLTMCSFWILHLINIISNSYNYCHNELPIQRWKNMVTPSVLIFFSCANFSVLHAIFCTILLCFWTPLQKISNFCKILFIFERLYIFFNALFVLIFQTQKLCLCYFSRFFQLCAYITKSVYLHEDIQGVFILKHSVTDITTSIVSPIKLIWKLQFDEKAWKISKICEKINSLDKRTFSTPG